MKRLFTILIAQFRRLTLIGALKLVKDSLFCNHAILIYAFDTSQLHQSHRCSSGEITIRKGTVEDLNRNMRRFDPVPWEFQCHIYDNVKDLYIAVSDTGVIQHVSWVYYEKDPNRIVKLGPGQAEIKYCLTIPEFRGRGIYPRVLKTIVSRLAEQEIRRVFICVKADNHASLRGVEKAGFTQVDRVRLIKVMGVQLSKRYGHED